MDPPHFTFNGSPYLDPILHQGTLYLCWIISLCRQQTALFRIERLLSLDRSFSIQQAFQDIRTHYNPVQFPIVSPTGALNFGDRFGFVVLRDFFLSHGLQAESSTEEFQCEFIREFSDMAAVGQIFFRHFPSGIPRSVLSDYQIVHFSHYEDRDEFDLALECNVLRYPTSVVMPVFVGHPMDVQEIYHSPPDGEFAIYHTALAIGVGSRYFEIQDVYGTDFAFQGCLRVGWHVVETFILMRAQDDEDEAQIPLS